MQFYSNILILDDDPGITGLIFDYLRLVIDEKRILIAHDPDQAIEYLEQQDCGVGLFDIHMPGSTSGIDLLQCVSEVDPYVAVVMITGDDSPPTVQQALAAGAVGYIAKPFQRDKLYSELLKAYVIGMAKRFENEAMVKGELQMLDQNLSDIVGRLYAGERIEVVMQPYAERMSNLR